MFWVLIGCLLVTAILVVVMWKPVANRLRNRTFQRAIDSFPIHRELLEAKFFDLASSAGKPRGLRWLDIEWLEHVRFAYDKELKLITAFAAVYLRFEAIEGGDMEDVSAVGDTREASAIFHYQNGTWGTGGRALFNMHPDDAVTRLQGQYLPISSRGPDPVKS